MKPDEILDCYGLVCPMPVFKTANKMKELKKGEILEVIATDEGIKKDIVSWCKATGNELLSIEEKDEEIHVFIRRLS